MWRSTANVLLDSHALYMFYKVYASFSLLTRKNLHPKKMRGPVAVGELPTLTHIPKFNLVLVISFCNREGSSSKMMIREAMEAKYKFDKTIVPCLLRMYFHNWFVQICE